MKFNSIFKLTAICGLILLLGFTQVYAGDGSRIGTAAGTQLQVPVGARDLVMGGSDIAYTSGLSAMYWNPAGLAHIKTSAAGLFCTMQIFNDINVNYIGLGFKLGKLGALGVDLKSFDFGDIPVTTQADPDGLSGNTYSPTMITLSLVYSKRLTDVISFGVTGKLVHEDIPRAAANAFAFDAGIQYHNLGGINGLSFGLAVKNIGTNLTYSGSGLLTRAGSVGTNTAGQGVSEFVERPAASDQLPANIELGVSYLRNINETNSITLSGNFDSQNFGQDAFKFGGEYMYNDLIAIRGGYQFLNDTDGENQLYDFSLGFGLHYGFGNTDLTFDYTFRNNAYFNGENMFSLAIGF